MKSDLWTKSNADRRAFIGGSDARIVMSEDEAPLLQLWKEKRGEIEPQDLTGDLLVQLGSATEQLNRHWFEKNTGHVVSEVQRQVFHNVHRWMAATLDQRPNQSCSLAHSLECGRSCRAFSTERRYDPPRRTDRRRDVHDSSE